MVKSGQRFGTNAVVVVVVVAGELKNGAFGEVSEEMDSHFAGKFVCSGILVVGFGIEKGLFEFSEFLGLSMRLERLFGQLIILAFGVYLDQFFFNFFTLFLAYYYNTNNITSY